MKVYTRTGDDGTTALFGGDRVAKTHPRITAYGTVDETNAALGLARSLSADAPGFDHADPILDRIQQELFVLGGDLAAPRETKYPVPRMEASHVEQLEHDIDALEEDLPALKHFILPGGSPAGAALHVARTVARRAERYTVELAALEAVNDHAARYLNRLSDFLFVLARWVNHRAGVAEAKWVPVDRKAKQGG
ncbi:MAG: cob(I)yrinic acid a,c-diamide adenosyltransferase [Bacteroidota bacterium]